MASFSGFIRKAPSARLRQFLNSRGVDIPDDCGWTSECQGTAFVRSVEGVLANLAPDQADTTRAELDHLASLADANGTLSAEQVCAGEGIDLEGSEGVQDVLLMLAIEHPKVVDRISSQASLMRRSGGKNWSVFQFEDDNRPWMLADEQARANFLCDAIEILELPDHRKREADWFTSVRVHPVTGEEREVVQATIYVEERAESELAFGPSSALERRVVPKVLEVGIVCDVEERILEICARGGKKVRDEYAMAFAEHFAPHSDPPFEAPRRNVMLDQLRRERPFETLPADGIDHVEVSALEFFSGGGGFARFERRGEDETLYAFLDRRFGNRSPLKTDGWHLTSGTLRIVLARNRGRRRRTLTVTLRSPNTTTIPNKTEEDRQFALDLLERWQLIASADAEEETSAFAA
ncbi:MAG: hypothetical protein AAFW83_06715 [Pseudomonadota bacterium]